MIRFCLLQGYTVYPQKKPCPNLRNDSTPKILTLTLQGVIGGSLVASGGPLGGCIGGLTMDVVISGVQTLLNGQATPSGSLKAWSDLVLGIKTKNPQLVIGSIGCALATPIFDLWAGRDYGATSVKYQAHASRQLFWVWFQTFQYTPPKSGRKKITEKEKDDHPLPGLLEEVGQEGRNPPTHVITCPPQISDSPTSLITSKNLIL